MKHPLKLMAFVCLSDVFEGFVDLANLTVKVLTLHVTGPISNESLNVVGVGSTTPDGS